MNLLKIIIYSTSRGKKPFTEWLNNLDEFAQSIIETRLDRVSIGNFGDCKQIVNGNGIWELRITYGPGYRVYFGKQGQKVVVLLLGGNKKSQSSDITKAKRYWAEYKELSND